MKTFKTSALSKTVLALATVATFATAVPGIASARYHHGRDNDRGRTPHHQQVNWGASRQIENRIQTLDQRIDQGIRTRKINRVEAQRLNRQLRDISQLKHQYERSGRGLTQAEARTLNNRLDRLAANIRSDRWAYNGR